MPEIGQSTVAKESKKRVAPVSEPREHDLWFIKVLAFKFNPSEEIQRVTCWNMETLAIHADLDKKGKWTLTHLPTQKRFLNCTYKEDCFKIGEYLWIKAWDSLILEDQEGLEATFPPELLGWLIQCKELERWVEP